MHPIIRVATVHAEALAPTVEEIGKMKNQKLREVWHTKS
jgi:hypothetical protein